MSDISRMAMAIGMGEGPRLGDRVAVDGLGVSTVNSWDMGYETAILDVNGTYPVERYDTEEEAEAGHARWIEQAKTLTEVTELGYGDVCDAEVVQLVRGDLGAWATTAVEVSSSPTEGTQDA